MTDAPRELPELLGVLVAEWRADAARLRVRAGRVNGVNDSFSALELQGLAQENESKADEVEQAIRAYAESCRGGGWQPIETAPKEHEAGSDSLHPIFLLALPAVGALAFPGARRVFEGRWCPEQRTFTSVNGFILLTGATHWQPLPAAPSPPKDQP